jgi:hypothetical protein
MLCFMRLRALVGVVGVSVVACTTYTDLQGSLGGPAGPDTAGTGAAAGDGPQGGNGNTSGNVGSSGTPNAGTASTGGKGSAGTAGNGGSGNQGDGGGEGGSGGNAGKAGATNEPEPKSITIGSTFTATAKHAPSEGGGHYQDDCPNNQVLIGFRSTIDDAHMDAGLRSLGGVCGTLDVGSSPAYDVTTERGGELPERESPNFEVETALCPADQVVVGFRGKSDLYMEALSFRCAPISITGNAPDFVLEIGNATDTDMIGDETSGTDFAAINCADGQVAVSQVMNAGAAIDNFGLRCADLILVVQ